MADNDSADDKTTKATPLQRVTAWVLGLAALIAAITVLATNSENLLKVFSRSKQPSEASSGPASPAPSDQPAVFSNGEAIIRGTWSFDLDNGVTAISRTDADLFLGSGNGHQAHFKSHERSAFCAGRPKGLQLAETSDAEGSRLFVQ